MQSSKILNLCASFMVVFSIEIASSKRQKAICIPCAEFKEWNICDFDGNDICITDTKELNKTLQKAVHVVQVEVTSKIDLQKSESHEGDTMLITITMFALGLLFSILFIFLLTYRFTRPNNSPIRRNLQTDSFHYMKRNKSEHPNTTTHLLKKREDPDLSLQRSFFKKNIDATLSRSELKKLKKSMKSVGILFWNNTGQGTVIRIGCKYILTAWHVIEPIVSSPGRVDHHGMAINSMNVQALKNKDAVYLDFSENTRYGNTHCRFWLLPKLCFIDKHLDVCILEVVTKGRTLPEPINVFRDFEKMNKGSTGKFVHVIGQHPETPNIVVDPGCEIILQDDKKVKEAKKWIKKHKREIQSHNVMEQDLHQSYDEVFGTSGHLILDTFLEFGASGGAVISFTPGGEVALIAILMRGIPSWFWTEGSRERGFTPSVRMEVACVITEILSSKEWRDSEKERIFGHSGHIGSTDDAGGKMETDQSEIGAFALIGPSTHGKYTNGNAMETDQLEKDAVDVKMSAISLKETC